MLLGMLRELLDSFRRNLLRLLRSNLRTGTQHARQSPEQSSRNSALRNGASRWLSMPARCSPLELPNMLATIWPNGGVLPDRNASANGRDPGSGNCLRKRPKSLNSIRMGFSGEALLYFWIKLPISFIHPIKKLPSPYSDIFRADRSLFLLN